jgi:hypothetical protein
MASSTARFQRSRPFLKDDPPKAKPEIGGAGSYWAGIAVVRRAFGSEAARF